MHELFGFGFYEWWCGLGHWTRTAIALSILAIGASLAWALPSEGFVWVPVLVTGCVLGAASLFAGA